MPRSLPKDKVAHPCLRRTMNTAHRIPAGLNVRARITIEQVWPEKKDPKSLHAYETYLKKVGRHRRQSFVHYDTENGAWTFDVPHF